MKRDLALRSLPDTIRALWRSRLGLEIRPAQGREALGDPGRSLIAVVRVDGPAPRSGLVLECPAPLARQAAARLRGVEPHVLEIEEVEEALGELALLTGARLWPDRRPSRPRAAIVDDAADRPRAAQRRPVRRAAFACKGYVFRVTVAG